MPIKVDFFTSSGEKKGQINLEPNVFGLKDNPTLLAQAIYVYRSNQRQNTKKSQTRAEVSLTTAKVYRQKGTGRARHGSKRAPIFVGGGVAHGPTGQENYRKSLSQKMRRASLLTALSNQATAGAIKIIDQFSFKPKSAAKSAASLFSKLIADWPQKTLIILDTPDPITLRAVRNLAFITATQLSRLNTYEVLNHRHLIFTHASIQKISSYQTKPSKLRSSPAKPKGKSV